MCDNNIIILESKQKYERKYGCPYCDTRATRQALVDHISQEHEELIPKGYTASRVVFNKINKKENGSCIICKKNTKWNEPANRYDRICSDACTKVYKNDVINKRMLDKYGKIHLLNDPEQQKKMLEGRKISGKHKFKDGGIKSYVGSYEKNLLEFMDKVLEIPSKDILTPGPIFYYEFKGEKLAWITDMLYIPFNLVFDVKDGGKNKNTHPDMKEYRDKQIEKEKAIVQSKQYNYIRLTDNNFQQLLEIMMDIKQSLMDESDIKKEPIVHINESVVGGIHSAPIGPVVYLMPYSKNNVGIEGVGMITDLMASNIFIVDSDTHKIEIKDKDYFKDYFYSIVKVETDNIIDKYKSILNNIKENKEILDLNYFSNLLLEDESNFLDDLLLNENYSIFYTGYDLSKFDPLNEFYMNRINNKIYLLNKTLTDNPIKIKYEDINESSDILKYVNNDVSPEDQKKFDQYCDSIKNKGINKALSDNNRFVDNYKDPRPDKDYDADELEKGIDIETEHVSNRYYSKIIAKDHLDKDPSYYRKLIKMEEDNMVEEESNEDKPILYIDRLNGAEKDTRPDDDYSDFELTLGRSIEFEHTSNYDIATIIAKDHLDEFPNYYSLMLEYDLIDSERDIDNRGSNIISEDKPLLENIIEQESSHIEELDFINIEDDYSIQENSINSDILPVYILLTDTGSPMSKVIKKLTKSSFNHVSLSFDSSLSKLYSFGVGDNDKKLTFALESKDKSYIERYKRVNSQLFAVFLDKTHVNKMKFKLDEFLANKNKLSYNWIGLIGYLIGKPISIPNKMFCSEFVDNMFKYVDIDLTNKNSGLVHPQDFSKSSNKRIYKIYDGELRNYNSKNILKNINKASMDFINKTNNIIKEVSSFPIQFDKEGNLLIKNYKKIDFEQEYGKSHKLLTIYEKNNNYEGIKYELSKLWFINSLVESKIYDKSTSDIMKKDLIKYRARVLNDFNKYLNFITSKEPEFNFTEYYNNTPFSDKEIFISKHTITGVKNIIKSILI